MPNTGSARAEAGASPESAVGAVASGNEQGCIHDWLEVAADLHVEPPLPDRSTPRDVDLA